ncbi:ZIP family metal transporter [Eubacteriales bacterium OttesenSCG-928-M02]|nr:ZIP family metal transporter [Eubacteriales bacterium OttesenSCG-928-M02]
MAFWATMGTWLVTALGAATVVFFHKPHQRILNIMMGFAAGVMIAASFWSLLQPAIERAEAAGAIAWLVAAIGFLAGALFIYLTDRVVSHTQRRANSREALKGGERTRRIFLLITSITMHNIPEGLAVGVAFGALANGYTAEGLMGAISIAVGIGLQNFPEGAAVSLPLRREGYSRTKSFLLGQASAIVEPIAGVIGAILVTQIEAILPFALAFAAGAMILVAVHEPIPECQRENPGSGYQATTGIIMGFVAMMILDVMLG